MSVGQELEALQAKLGKRGQAAIAALGPNPSPVQRLFALVSVAASADVSVVESHQAEPDPNAPKCSACGATLTAPEKPCTACGKKPGEDQAPAPAEPKSTLTGRDRVAFSFSEQLRKISNK